VRSIEPLAERLQIKLTFNPPAKLPWLQEDKIIRLGHLLIIRYNTGLQQQQQQQIFRTGGITCHLSKWIGTEDVFLLQYIMTAPACPTFLFQAPLFALRAHHPGDVQDNTYRTHVFITRSTQCETLFYSSLG
jgi:hypothetical protein